MDLNSYYLLELIEGVGVIQGRKKLQKLMYLLQFEGLPFEDQFFLHYYGPYSVDLASRIDFLTKKEDLIEDSYPTGYGIEYKYNVSKAGKKRLEAIGSFALGSDIIERTKHFVSRFIELNDNNVSVLELAATILYWRQWGVDREEAYEKTTKQKQTLQDTAGFKQAKKLASEIWNHKTQAA